MAARARLPPVVIGVVGDTGAGKSSMLNALLEGEGEAEEGGARTGGVKAWEDNGREGLAAGAA